MTDTDDTATRWTEYKSTGHPELRQQLVLHYASVVKYVASRVATGLPNSVEQGDLVSYEMFGLLDAIDKFDPDRDGGSFETYAIPRIRGAILDELRSMDWVPRSVRAKARRIEQAMGTFENSIGRSPSEEDLPELLDLGLEALRSTLGQIARRGILGLDETPSWGPAPSSRHPRCVRSSPHPSRRFPSESAWCSASTTTRS